MKVHLRDLKLKADDYIKSPHVRNKILRGEMPLCHQQTGIGSSFVDDIDMVTCRTCLNGGVMLNKRQKHE